MIKDTISNYKKMMGYTKEISVIAVDASSDRRAVLFVDKEMSIEDIAIFVKNNLIYESIKQEKFFKLYEYLEDAPCSENFEDKEDLDLFEQYTYRENPNKFFINELDDTYIFADQFYDYCINNSDSKFFFELADKCLGVMSSELFQKLDEYVTRIHYTVQIDASSFTK